MEQLLIDQMTEVQAQHPNLELLCDPSGPLWIRGNVGFSIEHDSHTIEDWYNLKFRVPDDYPSAPPVVYETEGKIPKDFGHFMAAGNFCLGTPVEVRRQFAKHKNLLRFIDDQVIPYLFAYSYKRDYGKLPFGELSHGACGLLEYYMDFFETSGIATMKLLKCLADDFAPPLMACPCGSGKRLKDCHSSKLDELRPYLLPKYFDLEIREMIQLAREAGISLPGSQVMPKRMWKQKARKQRRSQRKRKGRRQ